MERADTRKRTDAGSVIGFCIYVAHYSFLWVGCIFLVVGVAFVYVGEWLHDKAMDVSGQ